MANILINYFIQFSAGSKFNATVARMDVIKTFKSIGAETINFHTPVKAKDPNIRRMLSYIPDCIHASKQFKHIGLGDNVYFQYPYQGGNFMYNLRKLHDKGAHITILIHDLEWLRSKSRQERIDKNVRWLNHADELLVHTPQMADKLRQVGVTTTMRPIMLFDYYAKDAYRDIDQQTTDKNIIAFAGSLDKSAFLRVLDESSIPENIIFHLYGLEPKIAFNNSQMQYQCKFLPDHTGTIKAGWGLVWDGISIDTCSGDLGNYLRMIAPHKLSLYIASGIPPIVWSESAHAKYVTDNHIGIAVSGIKEAYSKIQTISNEEYKTLVTNCRNIGDELRKGAFLKRVLNY